MDSLNKGGANQKITIIVALVLVALIGVLGFMYSSRLAKIELALDVLKEHAQKNNIGILDIQLVIEESPRALAFQGRLDEIGEEIDLEFQEKSANLNDEAKQVFQQQAYTVYLKAKQQLEAELDVEIEKALQDIIKEENLGIIIYKQGLRMGGNDITNQVIAKLQ